MSRELLVLSRPRFWLYLAGPFLLGSLAASSSAWVSGWFWALLAFFLVPANILLYGVNDYFDADTDVSNPRKGAGEFLFSGQSWVGWSWLLMVFGGLVGVVSLGGAGGLFLALFLALAVAYSAPPFRFKARPLVDSLSNVLYVLPGFVGYSVFSGSLPAAWAVVGAWAWSAAMHLYSAVPDVAADSRAGLSTTAVVLGRDSSLVLCGVWWLLAFLCALYGVASWFVLVLLVYPVLAFALVGASRSVLVRVYGYFPLLNAVAGFVLFLGVL